jgi:hypothetical protein
MRCEIEEVGQAALLPVAQTLRSGKLDRPVKYRFFRRSNILAIRDLRGPRRHNLFARGIAASRRGVPVLVARPVAELFRGFVRWEMAGLPRTRPRRATGCALKRLKQRAAGADLALVFFAGHGVTTEEGNILVPINRQPLKRIFAPRKNLQAARWSVTSDAFRK